MTARSRTSTYPVSSMYRHTPVRHRLAYRRLGEVKPCCLGGVTDFELSTEAFTTEAKVS